MQRVEPIILKFRNSDQELPMFKQGVSRTMMSSRITSLIIFNVAPYQHGLVTVGATEAGKLRVGSSTL